MGMRKLGIWFIGARGSVATTVIAGALALKRKLIPLTGMITATDSFRDLDLVAIESLRFGGCDIRPGSFIESSRQMYIDNICIDARLLEAISPDLEAIEPFISMGTLRNCGDAIQGLVSVEKESKRSLNDEIDIIKSHLRKFKKENDLEEVVVVNLASTEPLLELEDCHMNIEAFEECLDKNRDDSIRASTLYAYSAIQEDCPFINFNASNGALIPAIVKLAKMRSIPVMGNDGKTGETLVKSVLAPLFTSRNLEVLSWEGFNILGNMDGKVLGHPQNKEAKLKTKDQSLSNILGYSPHSRVNIEYVPSLGDQKIAWDFIHFRGFMGIPMTMQVIWQGFDSILAAPLILDLVRLTELSKKHGHEGLMPHLALFFKAPLGVKEHRLFEQHSMLMDYVKNTLESKTNKQI
jgi:myo-inositol-1-phosphate synthase